MSKRDLAKAAAGKLVLDVLSNSYVNNEPESSSESSSSPRESQSLRLKMAQEDLLENVFAKNQFPSDAGYADIAKKIRKSVNEIVFWFNQRREKENNHTFKCYKRPLSETIQDSILDVDLEVDSEVDSEDSIISIKKSDYTVGQQQTRKENTRIDVDQEELESPSLKSPDDSNVLVKLETLLDPYLTIDGMIASYNDVPQILKIMSKRKDYLDKNYCIELLSNPRNSKQIMESIAKKMGLILLRVWLSGSSKDDNGKVLTEVILKLLKRLPTPTLDDLKQSKIGNAVKLAGNLGTLDAKNLADSIQAKWLQDIKKTKDSVPTIKTKSTAGVDVATAGSLQKQAISKAVKSSTVKSVSPAIPSASLSQVEKKTVTAISFDIFKSNPAASLPKIKKSDKPVVRKSPEVSPILPGSPSVPVPQQQSSSEPSGESSTKFSYRRSEQAESEKKRRLENTTDLPKKKRKSVTFAPDDSLKQIRYYERDSSEMHITDRESNHNFDKEEFTYAKSQANYRDEIKEAKEWSPPEIYYFDDDTSYTWGNLSEEKNVQNEREKKGFQSLYFKLEDIPDSPAEPDFENVPLTSVKPIPFEEFYSQNVKAKSAAAIAAQTSQRVPSITPHMGYNPRSFIPAMPSNYLYQQNQTWQNQAQYQHPAQVNPPRFVSQSNFYPGGQSQNNYYSGNSWGNQTNRPVCQNYKMGICTNGNQCPNLHTR